ncbi:MAG: hypothetical protein PHI03_08485, partial [Bacteroidales bacterium]|nr:hypothetical protein [Bacteroidales bacterium]
ITWSNSILSCVAVMALFFCKVTLLRNNHARVCLKIVMGVSFLLNLGINTGYSLLQSAVKYLLNF